MFGNAIRLDQRAGATAQYLDERQRTANEDKTIPGFMK